MRIWVVSFALVITGTLLTIILAITGMSSAASDQEESTAIAFSILRNAPLTASINEICCGKFEDKFNSVISGQFMTGFGMTAIWLRMDKLPAEGVLDFGPMIDGVTLFAHDPKTGYFNAGSAGDILPPITRSIVSPRIAIPVTKTSPKYPSYIKIVQENNHAVTPIYSKTEKYFAQIRQSNFLHTILISAISMMIIFNIVIGIIIRQLIFVLNAAVVVNLSVVNLYFTGVGPVYIWPSWAWASNSILELAVLGGCSASAAFFYSFLKTPGEEPLVLRAVIIVPILVGINFILWLFVPGWINQILNFLLIIITLSYVTIMVVVLAIKGSKQAQLLLPATLFAIFPGIISMLVFIHFSSEPLAPADHVFEFTLFFESLFFSLALAYRVRQSEQIAGNALQQLDRMQKNLNRRILETIDMERKRIAADLHDTAGQGLMSITTRLAQFLRNAKLTKSQKTELNKAAEYSRSVVGDLRRISHELHPAIIDHLGWRNAIEELFGTLAGTGNVDVELNIQVEENILTATQKLHLFRIVQELVSNIGKHTSASRCKAQFFQKDGSLHAVISDNGKLVENLGDEEIAPSLGHLIIGQRIDVLGGGWSINRIDDATVARMNFPIEINATAGAR